MIYYYIVKKQVWKGIHPTLPVYSKVNLVFSELEDANDTKDYLESNDPKAEYAVVAEFA